MKPTSDDVLRLIEELRIFADLTERERSILSAVFRPRGLERGQTLCREGEAGRSFFVVVDGTIEIHKELQGGRQELLCEVGRDNMLGEVALIDRRPRSATMKAATPALVLECMADDFDRLFWAGTPFAYKLLDTIVTQLAQRLREADGELHDLFSNPRDTLLKLHEAAIDVQRALNERGASRS